MRYSDPDNFYKPNVVVVEDANLISKYGYQVKEVLAFGCTSKYQAKRMGRWMLKTEELDASTVTFSVGLEGALVFPGQVFAIQDELRAAIRLSGRISSSTTTTIVADQSITLPVGLPTLTCVVNDGTIESRAISSVSGSTITVSSAFSSAPLVQAIYSISTLQVNEQKFRCLSVADNGDGTFAVTAVEFNDSIYDAAELDEELEFEDITVFDAKPPEPKNLSISFQYIDKDGGLTNRAIASWAAGGGGFTGSYVGAWRIGEGSYNKFDTTKTSLEVDGIEPGKTFQVKVRAVGVGFPTKNSKFVYSEKVAPSLPKLIEGEKILSNVSNLSITPISNTQATLHWTPPAVEKLNNLEIIIRHSKKTDGTGSFQKSAKLVKVPGTANSQIVPLLNGEYIIKVRDKTTKQKSFSEVSVVVNIPDPLPKLLVETRREDLDEPPFQGQRTGTYYSDDFDGLVLDGNETIDEKGLIDDLPQIDFTGNILTTGEYEFAATKTLPGKFEVNLERILESRSLFPDNTIDARLTLVDSWYDWDGIGLVNVVDTNPALFDTSVRTILPYENREGVYRDAAIRETDLVRSLGDTASLAADEAYQVLEAYAEDSSTQIYFRASDEVPTDDELLLEASPDIFLLEDGNKMLLESSILFNSEWTILDKTTFVGRTFQFKAVLQTDQPDETPLVDELGYILSIPSRTESKKLENQPAGAQTYSFTNAFYEPPNVAITAFNFASGDYYELTSVTRTGFTIHFKDSSNGSVSRDFNYVAAGFGSEQT